MNDHEQFKWIAERVSTVHTVQGRKRKRLFSFLGLSFAVAGWVRGVGWGEQYLLNVAVKRAKEALYMIENRGLWQESGHFLELDVHLN